MSQSFKPSVSLENFFSPSSLLASLFKPQQTYPNFFKTNLIDPHRVIFKFIDCPTNNAVRLFYFQLFRLCFHVKINQLLEPRDYLTELKSVVLDDRFKIKCNHKQSIDTQRLNNSMFKPLLREFFEIFQRETHYNFEDIIVKYPILDNIFLNVFKTFLFDFQVLKNFDFQLETNIIIQQLAKIFDLAITKIDKCYRFDEADIFCFVQNSKQLYIASKGKQLLLNLKQSSLKHISTQNQSQNKENININIDLTPAKNQKKKHLISTAGIIQEEPSQFTSSSQNSSSIFTKQSIQKFDDQYFQQYQSPIIDCEISRTSNKSAQSSLNDILQGQSYLSTSVYEDYTSTLVLQMIHQPHRANIRAMKDRAKQRKGLPTLKI